LTPILKAAEHDTIASETARLFSLGVDNDLILGFLREKGFNKIASIKTLVKATGISLGNAKEIVHHSRVWQDLYERDEEFHEQLSNLVAEMHKTGEVEITDRP